MANSEAIRRSVQRAKAEMEAHSARLFEQQLAWRDAQRRKPVAQMFSSTQEGDRGAVSPIGGVSPDWRWSGRKS
jgi:hypothetical protein